MPQNNPVQVFEGGWKELENAVFTDNQSSLSLGNTLTSFFIKPDGTELYVLETIVGLDDIIHTYPLDIPWDPTSRGAEIRSFVFSEDALGVGLYFQDDGTRMFVGGADTKEMFAFTLPVPYDTDSIVDAPVSLSLSAVTGVLSGSAFSRDGDFLFVNEIVGGFTYSFPLPTPWDITSNVSNTSFDTSLITLAGIVFKPEGDKMYLIDTSVNHTIHEFELSTPNDITTAVANGNTLDVSPVEILDLKFRGNGIELFTIDDDDLFTRRHSDDQWDVSTASLFTNEFPTGGGNTFAVSWKPDGLTFMVLDGFGVGRNISEFSVPNRWNVTGAVFVDSFDIEDLDNNIQCMYWRKDGLRCYVIGLVSDDLNQLNLTTPWDISTMSDSGIIFDLSGDIQQASGLYFRDDGMKFYVNDQTADDITEFDMSTPFDITTAMLLQEEVIPVNNLGGMFFRPDGKQLYVCDRDAGNFVVLFELTTPWDISTIVQQQTFDVGAQENSVRGVFIREDDGKKLYIIGTGSDTVFSYDMSLEFNNAILTDFGEEITTDMGETIVYA